MTSCGVNDVMVTSWSCRGARAKDMMHDDVMHISEVEPERVMGLGQAGPRARA